MRPVAIIPFRSLDNGKTRLAPVLSPDRRHKLCLEMLQRTIALVADVADVLVVSDDVRVGGVVTATLPDAAFVHGCNPGLLNQALDEARAAVVPLRPLAVVPTDLTFLDRNTLFNFFGDGRTLAIAPDRSQQGTNLLLLPAEARDKFRFQFGMNSFERHLAEAQRLGFAPRVLHCFRASFDLDAPTDLMHAGYGYASDHNSLAGTWVGGSIPQLSSSKGSACRTSSSLA